MRKNGAREGACVLMDATDVEYQCLVLGLKDWIDPSTRWTNLWQALFKLRVHA